MAIDLYGSLAVHLARDVGDRDEGHRRRRREEVRLARAFVRGAKYRMVGHLKEMDKNRDAEQTAIADMAYASLAVSVRLLGLTGAVAMSIRILVTGGTFDKEYDELSGRLYFLETHVPRCCASAAAASTWR